LYRHENAGELADCLIEYLKNPELQAVYSMNSRNITLQRHTAANFLNDIQDFWSGILKDSGQ
jgi:hypothetical protein